MLLFYSGGVPSTPQQLLQQQEQHQHQNRHQIPSPPPSPTFKKRVTLKNLKKKAQIEADAKRKRKADAMAETEAIVANNLKKLKGKAKEVSQNNDKGKVRIKDNTITRLPTSVPRKTRSSILNYHAIWSASTSMSNV
jgi:hypothetical protein